MTELDTIDEMEDANYQTSMKVLGDTAALSEDLVELYRLLVEISTKSKIAGRDEVLTPLHLLLACQYQLTIGCLAALRGHLTDSFRSSRMALEQAAFAARVKRHPHLALVWLNAGQSDEEYAEYREKFSTGKIFPEEHALLRELGSRYDHASKLGHPSVYAMAGHTKAKTSEAGFSLEFKYFELKHNDPSEPTRTFLWIIDTHFGILRLFEEVLSEAIAHDVKAWEVRRNGVDARLGVHKHKWKDIILKPRSQ